MSEKPTYEELEQRINELEAEANHRKRAEEEFRKSEARHRTLAENSSDMIYRMSLPDGKYEYVSSAATAIFGYPPETWYDNPLLIREVMHSEWHPFFKDQWHRLLKGDVPPTYEYQIVHKDGSIRWINQRNVLVRGEDDCPVYIEGVVTDITERKQAEEALRESEKKYRHLFETAMVGIYRTRLEDGKFLAANKSLAKMMGYESVNTLVEEYVTSKHYADPKRREELLNKLQSDGKVDGFEIEMERVDGSRIQIALSATVYPDRGYLEGAIIDITERKQAEEALRTSHERFLTVLDSIDATIYVADMETYEILFMNKYMVESFGRDMTGEICWDVFRKESRPCPHCTNDQLIDENGKSTGVCVWQGENPITGKWYINHDRTIEWTDGRLVRLQIATDITKLKEMEEELRQAHKMESVGTLAGGIAHDFNNILGIILGNAELAMDDVPEWNPALFNLKEIKTAILRAKDVVRQLLSFARKTKLEKKPTNIIPIVKESLKLLRSSIPTSIEIRPNISKDVGTILADPTQINQVLINLCTNADHAMPDGGVISVTLRNVDFDEDTVAKYSELNPGRYVNLAVSDTGHGISQEEIDRIFDPYFTTKEVGKGTGMGLAVVHGIVKEHNGIITVESEVGRGTTFSIFFPAVAKEAVIETETDEKLPAGDERILFIDDEESIAKLERRRLERLGYKVEAIISPIEALDLFRSKPNQFDLVITDLTMPKMTGDKLVKEILNIRPDIPIILCTGFNEKIDEKKAKTIGVTEYIEKPLYKHDFAFKVRKVLGRK